MNIFIDIGHGVKGQDGGTTGELNGKTYYETDINLVIGLAAKERLEALGHNVTTSRSKEENVAKSLIGEYEQPDSNLIKGAELCKAGNYGCMVSIHNNWAESDMASGYQIYFKTGNGVKEKSQKLANCIGKKLRPIIGQNMIGTAKNNAGNDKYGILRLHDKTGVIVECGFMTCEKDLAIISTKQKEIGYAIAEGIHEYSGEKAKTEELPKDVSYYAELRGNNVVSLTVTKDFDLTIDRKSGAVYWASVLENGTDRIKYFAAVANGEVFNFAFTKIIGVTSGATFTKSNAISYTGAVTRKDIQAWYLLRGTKADVKGTATIQITGFVDNDTYLRLMK